MHRCLLSLPLMAVLAGSGTAALPAFPGAEGYGAASRGGRGGRVIEVTNLDDRGPGSLRAALTAEGPRLVVFRVAGIIELESGIAISHPYLTVAGQTAPGGGITLKAAPGSEGEMLDIRTHDVVLRYLRIRSGAVGKPGHGQVNIGLHPRPAEGKEYGDVRDIVIDHCSVSWTLDENIDMHRNLPEDDPKAWQTFPRIYNVSVQRTLIAEGLYPHSTGLRNGGEQVIRDGRCIHHGGRGVADISIQRNLFASSSHRNPALGCQSARVINNVMYNWGTKCSESHQDVTVDWIGNWFKPGPLSTPRRLIVHNDFYKGFPQHRHPSPSIYLAGNRNASDAKQTDWEMITIHYENTPIPAKYRRDRPMPAELIPVAVLPAEKAYERVLADVGANRRLNADGRWADATDSVDRRILDDARLGRGQGAVVNGNRVHITHPDQVGGYPRIEPGTPYADADHDGMADRWETLHGLDPANPADAGQDADGDGYTNVEEFLNGTNPGKKDS